MRLCVLLWISLAAWAVADRALVIPDLTQTDPRGNFARGGKSFCGPVAVSNSLMALYRNDFAWEEVTQYELVNQLASQMYMNTHPVKGTSADQLMRGVGRFLREQKEKDYYLKFQGWRLHQTEFRTGVNEPRLSWIKETLGRRGAVWLNVGWYKQEEEGVYRRFGGHWVTLVAHGRDQDGEPNPNILVIHDPSPRTGAAPAREFVLMTRMERGKLVGVNRNLPRPARWLYKMEGGMHLKPGADVAILDGAVSLRMKKAPGR